MGKEENKQLLEKKGSHKRTCNDRVGSCWNNVKRGSSYGAIIGCFVGKIPGDAVRIALLPADCLVTVGTCGIVNCCSDSTTDYCGQEVERSGTMGDLVGFGFKSVGGLLGCFIGTIGGSAKGIASCCSSEETTFDGEEAIETIKSHQPRSRPTSVLFKS